MNTQLLQIKGSINGKSQIQCKALLIQSHTHTKMKILVIILLFTSFSFPLSHSTPRHEHQNTCTSSTILFSTVGRPTYNFDIYTLPFPNSNKTPPIELRLTDGTSVNYNGHFPSLSSPSLHLLYITERNGSSNIYLDTINYQNNNYKTLRRNQDRLIGDDRSDGRVSMKDRPSLVDDYLIYVSTHEETGKPRSSWAAVYSTRLSTRSTRRLTPYGVADFSPAVSPSGEWTAVASLGERKWGGEIEELDTDIYVFKTADGSGREKVAEHGGWPSWADESSLYFHRRGHDGWWSVYKASRDSMVTHRVTPPGVHAFTPAASVANKSFIVVATRRPDSGFRHIEIYNIQKNKFIDVTRSLLPRSHHYNPFISPDSTRIGYHKCRGNEIGENNNRLLLENVRSPIPDLSLFRIYGSFPSFSPTGDRIAFVDLAKNKNSGLYVMNRDGSGLRRVVNGTAFSTAWDPKRKGIVYTSMGTLFASESTKVDVISVNIDEKNIPDRKILTTGGENNAFPSPSPDGKWVVFRSGRSGYKNLYVMDAVGGERKGIYRLTDGPWTDTMANWAPGGEWIAFASDRENPGSGSFEIFMVRPDGSGIKKLVQSGTGGRANHPWFSPDGKSVVFTSDYGGVSAEPISTPHQFQPYGDIFVIRSDGGGGVKRLTHNSYEDGTPTWGNVFLEPEDVGGTSGGTKCGFDDCHWLSDFPNQGLMSLVSDEVQCGH